MTAPEPFSCARNGSAIALATAIFNEASEQHRQLRMHRDAARWCRSGPADASTWPFVVREWVGPPTPYENLELCTGAELAAKYAWARYQGDDCYRPQVWVLTGHHLCLVDIRWGPPGLADDGAVTCEGTVNVADTRIARLSYVMHGPAWSER